MTNRKRSEAMGELLAFFNQSQMKKLLLVFFIPLLFSCSNDDPEENYVDFWNEKDIIGTWIVVQDIPCADLYQVSINADGTAIVNGSIPTQHVNPECKPFERKTEFSFLDDIILLEVDDPDWFITGKVISRNEVVFEIKYQGSTFTSTFRKKE